MIGHSTGSLVRRDWDGEELKSSNSFILAVI